MMKLLCRLTICAWTLCLVLSSSAWDVEHDEIAQLAAESLPTEIRSFFTFDDFAIVMANCHYPDWIEWPMEDGSRRSHTLEEMEEIVGKEDAAQLLSQGIKMSSNFHSARGRAVLLTMLARSFGRGDGKSAAFYLSLLTHVVSDISALNHPPVLQFLLNSRFPGVDYPVRKVEEGAKNAFGFRSDGHVVHLVRERMRSVCPCPYEGDWQKILVEFAADEVRQGAFAAEKEVVIGFAPQKDAETALVDLVVMQVSAIVNACVTAWQRRAADVAYPSADFDSAFERESKRLAAGVDPARQGVFSGIFDDARDPSEPKGHVTIVCEPYAYLACKTLSYVGRQISASAGRTLRDAGYAVSGLALADVGRRGLPEPKPGNFVLVSLGPGTVSDAAAAAFSAYRRRGGRLLIIGGSDPKDISGMRDILEELPDDEVPVSSKWGVRNEDVWQNMSVVYAGRKIPFTRNPNIDGYSKPYASCVFKVNSDVTPVLVLDNGRERRIAGGRKGNVLWLPEYALMPFVLSDTKELEWASMRLDEPGRTIILREMESL